MIVTIKFTEACRQGLLGEVEEEKEKGNHDYKEEYEDKNQFFFKKKEIFDEHHDDGVKIIMEC